MSRLDDKTRLVAIGLLNLADDEGYFMADPLFVKSQLFPFTDDSLRIHGALTTLSTIGWIEAIKHPTHGPIARVVNFRKHQKINRPTPSKIKAYWINDDSLRIHGGLTEDSLLEQGTGNREQGNGGSEISPRLSTPENTTEAEGMDDMIASMKTPLPPEDTGPKFDPPRRNKIPKDDTASDWVHCTWDERRFHPYWFAISRETSQLNREENWEAFLGLFAYFPCHFIEKAIEGLRDEGKGARLYPDLIMQKCNEMDAK
jgi:hypothetical protein